MGLFTNYFSGQRGGRGGGWFENAKNGIKKDLLKLGQSLFVLLEFSLGPVLRPVQVWVLMCLLACLFVPPHIFYHDGCPTWPIYLEPPIFLQIPDTLTPLTPLTPPMGGWGG